MMKFSCLVLAASSLVAPAHGNRGRHLSEEEERLAHGPAWKGGWGPPPPPDHSWGYHEESDDWSWSKSGKGSGKSSKSSGKSSKSSGKSSKSSGKSSKSSGKSSKSSGKSSKQGDKSYVWMWVPNWSGWDEGSAWSKPPQDDDDWAGTDDDDDDRPSWESDGHTGFYKPNPDGSPGWANDGHYPGTYVDFVEQDSSDYDPSQDGNAYSLHDYNHVTDLCYATCSGDHCTYHVLVDLYASEFGGIVFEECKHIGPFPTITMELGKTYRFVQTDRTNYIHPIGFGYHPDSPHQGLPEIDPANPPPGTDGSCAEDESCPEAKYFLNGDRIPLEQYENMFAHPIHAWVNYGDFSAELMFPKGTGYSYDIFYWCHLFQSSLNPCFTSPPPLALVQVHGFMGGRIKLLHNGKLVNRMNFPIHKLYFAPPSPYDQRCGTYGLQDFQLPHPECPHRFVCNVDDVDTSSIYSFAGCLESMNCHMFVGMTTYATQGDVALFLQDMIPHHQNAVNMAKSLLLKWNQRCEDLGDSESDVCIFEGLLREIVNSQNAQIQLMRDLLASNGWREFEDCPVKMSSFEEFMQKGGAGSNYEHNYDNDDAVMTVDDGKKYKDDDGSWSDDGHDDDGDDDDGSWGDDNKASGYRQRALSDGSDMGGICKIPCNGDVCDIYVRVNLFATVLGAYTFDECGDQPYPTIGLEIGKTYRFVQKELNNYYHPLGFAYFADGAHANKQELEDEYLKYKIDNKEVGLDNYEPKFFFSPREWGGFGTFNVEFTIPEDHGEDLFYFCHIHEFMSGRIKLLRNGVPVSYKNVPEMPYMHEYQDSRFDKSCGTMHLGEFQLPHPECPHKFVCDGDDGTNFAQCLDAMNCAMMVGMTTYVYDKYNGDVALFNHQMIPHHENAVNMAKALLHEGVIRCPDITSDTDDCKMEGLLHEIVNNQNFQIQQMRGILERDGFPEFNDCVVNINSNHHLRR
ncbi:hypothetical protein ACHAWX_007261 [Stephanocyclus meneghinianus]